MVRFSGELSAGFPKVVGRFITEMVYGLQARQSVRLTEVSRELDEAIPIKKTVERLSRQLGNPKLGAELTSRLLRLAADRIRETTLLILDISDVHKKYAKKMEHLGKVTDGSEKAKGWGYWMLNILGAEVGSAQVLPLYGRLYSHRAPEFESENIELREAIGQVSEVVGRRGIWDIDWGGLSPVSLLIYAAKRLKFIIRLKGVRHLLTETEESALEAAWGFPMLFNEYIAREDGGEEKPLRLEVGCRRVRLPGRREELTPVVVKGFGQERMMLLTNLAVKRSRKSVRHVVAAYLTRWRIEETIRFIKQCYKLEDIRVLRYVRLQNMMAVLMAVIYFTAGYLGIELKLRVLARHIVRAARRVFGIPDFRLYAWAMGPNSPFSIVNGGWAPISPLPNLSHNAVSSIPGFFGESPGIISLDKRIKLLTINLVNERKWSESSDLDR